MRYIAMAVALGLAFAVLLPIARSVVRRVRNHLDRSSLVLDLADEKAKREANAQLKPDEPSQEKDDATI